MHVAHTCVLHTTHQNESNRVLHPTYPHIWQNESHPKCADIWEDVMSHTTLPHQSYRTGFISCWYQHDVTEWVISEVWCAYQHDVDINMIWQNESYPKCGVRINMLISTWYDRFISCWYQHDTPHFGYDSWVISEVWCVMLRTSHITTRVRIKIKCIHTHTHTHIPNEVHTRVSTLHISSVLCVCVCVCVCARARACACAWVCVCVCVMLWNVVCSLWCVVCCKRYTLLHTRHTLRIEFLERCAAGPGMLRWMRTCVHLRVLRH